MNRQPTYTSIAPVETGPFNRRQNRGDKERARWSPKHEVLPAAFNAGDFVLPTAVAAIRKAFTTAKTSHRAWKSVQREGRFDVRQAPRISRGAQDVFKRQTGRSTTRVHVGVLLDASGSMNNADARIGNPLRPGSTITVSRRIGAAMFGATMAKALGTVPTVDLDVFQHAAGSGENLVIKWRWSKGTPVGAFNEAVDGIGPAGNADGHALYAITERMIREVKRDERGIIMVVSDGLPSDYPSNGTVGRPERQPGETSHQYEWRVRSYQAGQALIDAVAHARKNGIEVIAVAIDGSDQSAYYGKGVIRFNGNWTTLGSELARHIGRAMGA